jgi:hypothetical protein
MSVIKSKKYTPYQTRILFVVAFAVVVIFSLAWSILWLNVKPRIVSFASVQLVNLKNNLTEFNDVFQPVAYSSAPMPEKDKKTNSGVIPQTTEENIVAFDSVYYFYLWDKMIAEFGMAEADSLTIDSLVKLEMAKNIKQNPENENVTNEDFSIKKDELLFVTALKPVSHKAELFSAQDSVDFQNAKDNAFTIEFWKSPLNYQGIKTTGSLILVYGVSDFDNISVCFIEKQSFALKLKNKMYALKNDGKYYPFRELQMN